MKTTSDTTFSEIGSAETFEAVTPSNSTNYTGGRLARGLYVGVAGDVVVVDSSGSAVTFTAVPAGTVLPVMHQRVNSTSTTATNMVALF